MPNRKIKSWDRLEIRHLSVTPDMLGNQHEFSVDGATVTVRLPERDQVGKLGEEESSLARGAIFGWDKDGNPEAVWVNDVDVEVNLDESADLPAVVLEYHPNVRGAFSDEEQQMLQAMVNRHGRIALEAHRRWIRVLRWVCNDHRIGREVFLRRTVARSTALVDRETNHRVWLGGACIRAPGVHYMTEDEWGMAQQRLSAGDMPPIHLEFFHDGILELERGNFRKAFVDFSICCEVYLRRSVSDSLPDTLDEKITDYIESGNITQFFNHFFPRLVHEEDHPAYKKLKRELPRFFDSRNKLMHLGASEKIDRAVCTAFKELLDSLLSISLLSEEECRPSA